MDRDLEGYLEDLGDLLYVWEPGRLRDMITGSFSDRDFDLDGRTDGFSASDTLLDRLFLNDTERRLDSFAD